MQILRDIEHNALAVRAAPPGDGFAEIDDLSPRVNLVADRPLYAVPLKPEIDDSVDVASGDEVSADALFDRVHVDKTRLAANVWTALSRKDQVSLSEVVASFPLEQGLAELVTYLSVAADTEDAVIDDTSRQTIDWTDEDGNRRQATLPLVIFTRNGSSPRTAASGGAL